MHILPALTELSGLPFMILREYIHAFFILFAQQ